MKITVDIPICGLLSQQEAASLLHVSHQMILKHERKNRLHRVTINGKPLYYSREVDSLRKPATPIIINTSTTHNCPDIGPTSNIP